LATMTKEQARRGRSGDPRRVLAGASVLVAGLGALGSAAARRLADAGVGRLVLVDPDVVELSNLHRQLLHDTSRIGRPKVDSAAESLRAGHPRLCVETHVGALDPTNSARYLAAAEFVIDATDGVASKFLLNDAAVLSGRPYSHAGILGFRGQTMTVCPGRSACYRCLFPEPPAGDEVPSCREAGIVGAVAGVIGSIQAAEAIRTLLGTNPALLGSLMTFDALTFRWRRVEVRRAPDCPACGDRPPAGLLDAAGDASYGS
jgi:molybdopterin/thiamine biosynthesis adenylyltransferase